MAAARQRNLCCSLRASRGMLAALALVLALGLIASPAAFASVSTGSARLIDRSPQSLGLGFGTFSSTGDPVANSSPSQATWEACGAAPTSADCISSALADIDTARAAEGVGSMQLPSDFASLTVQQQLLVVTDLERVARGLTPVRGLAADLDNAAQQAAAADQDPMLNNFNGDELASNWAGGISSTLLADFVWMYDDGPGSDNIDCQQAGDSGCWGHRHNILFQFDDPTAMGVGYDASTNDGPSLTELFIGGDTATGAGQADALLSPTWAQLSGQASSSPPPTAKPASVKQAPEASQALASIWVAAGRRRIRRGQRVTLRGRLSAAGSSTAGQLVTLFRHAPGSTKLTVVRRKRTHAGGRIRFHLAPRASMVYTVVFSGSGTLAAAHSGAVEVRVRRRHRSG